MIQTGALERCLSIIQRPTQGAHVLIKDKALSEETHLAIQPEMP